MGGKRKGLGKAEGRSVKEKKLMKGEEMEEFGKRGRKRNCCLKLFLLEKKVNHNKSLSLR